MRSSNLASISELPSRVPSLDGLRAVSLLMVLLGHLSGTQGFVDIPMRSIFGALGVRVFFVISGFIITHLLLKELAKEGHIHIGRFYFRRTLRIFPAYFLFLGGMALAMSMGWITLNSRDLLHAVTYTSNYYPERSWNVAHLWSLACEEQFYLIMPLTLAFLGMRRSAVMALVVLVACPIIRVLMGTTHDVAWNAQNMGIRFETIADSMAMGCLLAGFRSQLHANARYRAFFERALIFIAPLMLLFSIALFRFPLLNYLIGYTLMNLSIAMIIDWVIHRPEGTIGRVLNWRPMVWIGMGSYSMYLWQQPFLNREEPSLWTSFPQNLIFAAIAAAISYFVVEKPALRLRERLEKMLFSRQKVAPIAEPVP